MKQSEYEAVLSKAQGDLAKGRDTLLRLAHLEKTATDLETRAKLAGMKAEAETYLNEVDRVVEDLEMAGFTSVEFTDRVGRPIGNPFRL